jgi:hypothetical protein
VEFPNNSNIRGLIRTQEDFDQWYELLEEEEVDAIVLDSHTKR